MLSDKSNNKKKYKNNDVIFIHFDYSNSKKIGFLISFIINNYYKNERLKFIFIIHVKRNFILINKEKQFMPCQISIQKYINYLLII